MRTENRRRPDRQPLRRLHAGNDLSYIGKKRRAPTHGKRDRQPADRGRQLDVALQPAIAAQPAEPQRNGFGRRFHRRMYPDRPAYQRTVGRSLRHHCQAAHRSLWLHGRRTGTKPRRRFAAQAGRIRQDRRRERPPAESRSPHADRPELDRRRGLRRTISQPISKNWESRNT